MKLAHSFALVLAIATMSGFRSDDTFTLRQKYKKDEVQVYQMGFNISAEDSEIVMDMKNSFKVLSVEDDGAYELEETLISGMFKFNGEEHAMEKGEPKANKYDKNGKRVKKEGDDDEENDPITQVAEDVFEYEPKDSVKIGDTWTHEGEYGTMTLTLEGKEKVGEIDCLKISLKGTIDKKDSTGSVVGTYLVRESDFSPEKMEAKIENPKLDADSPAMKKIELKMVRLKE